MFVLTFSPLGEKVNTNMALIHRQVKKSTLGKIVNNYPHKWQFNVYKFFSFSRDEHSISLISRSKTSLSFAKSVLISNSVVKPTLFRNVISIDISIR